MQYWCPASKCSIGALYLNAVLVPCIYLQFGSSVTESLWACYIPRSFPMFYYTFHHYMSYYSCCGSRSHRTQPNNHSTVRHAGRRCLYRLRYTVCHMRHCTSRFYSRSHISRFRIHTSRQVVLTMGGNCGCSVPCSMD